MVKYKGKILKDLGKNKLVELLDEQVKINLSMRNTIKELYEVIENNKKKIITL